MHKSGQRYRWRQDERLLQEMPQWLHGLLLKAQGAKRHAPSVESASSLIPEGGRNSHLTSLAGTMRRRGLNESAIVAALLEDNRERCTPPLSESEVHQIAQSISRYETAPNGGNTSEEKMSQRLIRLADQASFFHSPDGGAFASVVDSGKRENWPINSKDFTTWLTRCYWRETNSAPSKSAMAETQAVLEGKARFDGAEVSVFTRVAEESGTIYLDLADPERRVVEISGAGWKITTEPPVRFRRAKGMRPLPVPVVGGSVEELRRFVNLDTEADWVLLISWLLAAFRPRGPYPLAGLHGEHGSAKSTTARVMRELVDPNVAPLRCEPRSIQDFMIAATNGWVIALDNLSRVDGWLSDALCRLSTGGGFSTRTLYENSEETILEAQRPVILTGIEELATRSDLLDRSLVMYLPSIPETERQTEKSFWEDFQEAHPRILGALLDAVACALRELPNVTIQSLPRLADFATWITAAEPGLGWDSGTFLKAYKTNRQEANNVALEASLLAGPIVSLVDKGLWSGTAEQLLRRLETSVPDTVRRATEWPKTARSLSGALRRLAPNLRPLGIRLTFRRDNTRERNRIVTIDRPVPSNPSEGPVSQAIATP
jgi:hypothetical protein